MSPLNKFLLQVLLWLPICFAAWYFLSILFTGPLASIVGALMTWIYPAIIERVAQDGNGLIVITHLVVSMSADDGGAAGEILFELNPLKYGYCVPLYTALVLATPGDYGTKVMRWLIGNIILLAVQVFGVSAEILKLLAFEVGDEASAMLGFSAWGYEAVALAYQLGSLILPPVVPIMIWFGQFQDALPNVLRKTAAEV